MKEPKPGDRYIRRELVLNKEGELKPMREVVVTCVRALLTMVILKAEAKKGRLRRSFYVKRTDWPVYNNESPKPGRPVIITYVLWKDPNTESPTSGQQ